jgi:AmiR/NasT family two-component response regulator
MTTEQGASVARRSKKAVKLDAEVPGIDTAGIDTAGIDTAGIDTAGIDTAATTGVGMSDDESRAAKPAGKTRKRASKGAPLTESVAQLSDPEQSVPPVAAGPGPGDPARRRVVIAEDEPLIRLDLAEMLTEAGYDVVGQAPDGKEAVALTREMRPDLVLLDVKMPILDGLSAAEQIGAESLAPVVMLTAFSQRELVERASEAGVMAYVVKPFTIADLTPAIEVAASRWQQMRALEVEIADLADRLETRKLVDRAKGLLMSQLKLSEPEAFRWVQKTAMDRRLSMREVAELVIEGIPGKKG